MQVLKKMSKKTIPFYRCNDVIFEYIGNGKYKVVEPIKIYPCNGSIKEKDLQKFIKMFEPYVYIETKEE